MHSAEPPVSRLATLAAALEAVAAATASAKPDALAACEAPLEAALAHVPQPAEVADGDPAAVAEHLRRIQTALARCRAVGYAVTDLVRVSLSAQGVAPGYRPAGIGAPSPRLGRLEVRV